MDFARFLDKPKFHREDDGSTTVTDDRPYVISNLKDMFFSSSKVKETSKLDPQVIIEYDPKAPTNPGTPEIGPASDESA